MYKKLQCHNVKFQTWVVSRPVDQVGSTVGLVGPHRGFVCAEPAACFLDPDVDDRGT